MALTTIHDPGGNKHTFDSSVNTFQGFQIVDRHPRLPTLWRPQFTSAKPKEPAGPSPQQVAAQEVEKRSQQQKTEIDNYFQEKQQEVEALIPEAPQGPATAVDQGATVRDLQIASEGDNEAAQARSTRVSVGGAAQKRRRSSMLTIPTF